MTHSKGLSGARLGAAALLAGLSACTVGPDYEAPRPDLPASYSLTDASTADPQSIPSPGQDLPTDEQATPWWSGFQDEALDTIIEDALEGNLDIAVARADLADALQGIRAERSDLFPTLDGIATGTVREGPGADTASASPGLAMAFNADLFGGQRRRLEQAKALAGAASWDAEDIRRLTIFAVASQYVNLRRTQTRLDLLDTSLELQRQTLEIVRQRLDAGISSDLDVQRARADLARTRAQRGTLAAAKARAENALAVLAGRNAGTGLPVSGDTTEVPVFAGGPPLGVPAALIRARPDVLAAEEGLKAATAAIGVETADLYPALRLPGQVSAAFGGAQAATGQVTATLSAVLDVPLFDAGRRRAEVRSARARADAARALYLHTVLEALRDVENALADLTGFQQSRDELQLAIDASEQAFNQLNALYQEGLASFIDILDAQRTLIASREAYVEAEADLAGAVIDLYRAVGAPTQTPVNAS